MKKIIFIVVVAASLAMILMGCGQKNKYTEVPRFVPNDQVSAESTVIRITKDGFSPTKITVPVNTAVTFMNEDTQPHWPASNIHPTHGIWPEFDPLEGFPGGTSWTFVFDKKGIWRFHDHLKEEWVGVITVN